jgi:protein-tyrosine phosphatase
VTNITPPSRWIDLDGAANVRDLGGLPAAGGARTASGVLVRADNLQDLSRRDVGRLVGELGVGLVVDLRTGPEVELEGPGPLVHDDRVEIRHRSLYPEEGLTDVDVDAVLPWHDRLGSVDTGETPAVRAYLGYLRERPDSITGALRDVAQAPGAVVVHCAAGKDRTGTVCALALAVAGVPREEIVADYVATVERLEPLIARLAASPTYAHDIGSRPVQANAPRAETMWRVLELLDERHGGANGWLDEHGFAEADRAVLRDRLLGGPAAG